MDKILCAIRGGPDSRPTQEQAIALAKERGDALIFLYVADVSFLDRTAAPLVVDVESELELMGWFQLAMAREQAAAQGVEAEIMVRHGHLQSELVAAARQVGATLILLGCPLEKTAVFDHETIQTLAAHLQAATGAEVRIV